MPVELEIEEWTNLVTTWRVKAVAGGDAVFSDHEFHFTIEPYTKVENMEFDNSPTEFEITSIFPNPFNPVLSIKISLPELSHLNVSVFNVTGQEVASIADRNFDTGYHNLTFNADNLYSGIYFINASVAGKMNDVKKVVLAKSSRVRRSDLLRLIPLTEPYVRFTYTAPVYFPLILQTENPVFTSDILNRPTSAKCLFGSA
ncbi:MAG: T9SS type A sorting domain-containing protein [Candidatus Electryonea clarkiae]|nr:T9SS type A sorting domain-containing protein [Candidatus Electryonea clarkiae]